MDLRILIIPFFILSGLGAAAQDDSLILTKNYHFNDGVYLSFEAFQSNDPDYQWDELRANLVTNPQTFLTQIQYVFIKNEREDVPLELDKIWCVSLAGIPYINLTDEGLNKDMVSFAGLQLRGKICYYSFEDYRVVQIPMHAYNPYTGKPFRSGMVERKKQLLFERILNFETGEKAELTVENLKKWITDDKKLLNTMNSLPYDEVKEKLFKCLLIYDDRNVVRIKKIGEGGKEDGEMEDGKIKN